MKVERKTSSTNIFTDIHPQLMLFGLLLLFFTGKSKHLLVPSRDLKKKIHLSYAVFLIMSKLAYLFNKLSALYLKGMRNLTMTIVNIIIFELTNLTVFYILFFSLFILILSLKNQQNPYLYYFRN